MASPDARDDTDRGKLKSGISRQIGAGGELSAMRVLVCGGRDFTDQVLLEAMLDRLHHARVFTVLIEGDARGADRMAGAWAEARGIAQEVFKADWDGLGAKAGPIRNQQMLDQGRPDLVVAFPGAGGTEHMKRIARAAGIEVVEVEAGNRLTKNRIRCTVKGT